MTKKGLWSKTARCSEWHRMDWNPLTEMVILCHNIKLYMFSQQHMVF